MRDVIMAFKSKVLDYLPLMLIPLLFIAEEEMEHHALKTSFQLGIVVLTSVIFFLIFFKFRSRSIAFISAVILWAILQNIKNRMN